MPPLRTLRTHWLEAGLVAFAVADGVSVLLAGAPRHRPLVACLAVASVLVLAGWRYAPLTVSVGAFAVLAVGSGLTSTLTTVQFFGILVTFAVVGAVNSGRDAGVAWLSGIAAVAYTTLVLPTGLGWPDFLLTSAFCSTMTAAGWLVSHRSRQVHHVRHQAEEELRAERERAARALAEQRAELARELHDVVSHGLSVMVLQSQAARLDAEDLDSTGTGGLERRLDAIEQTAREALGEMRRLLGLLQLDHGSSESSGPAPSPGITDLPSLVERARAGGLDVELWAPDEPLELTPGLGLTVYRVVQEALTNAAKHAPGSRAEVRLAVDAGVVDVQVTSTAGTGPARDVQGAGRGLAGMRERVEMYDGRLAASPWGQGGFRVRAVVPLDEQHALGMRDAERLA
jgi:signal transduction histidine kinase